MPSPTPHSHAHYLQFPPHHRAPVSGDTADSKHGNDGPPYAILAAHQKALSIWKLIHSLEIGVGLYCEQPSEEEGEDEEEDDDEGDERPRTMLALTKACIRLHSQLTAMYALKHSGFSQFEHAQLILKVLTLLAATVEVKVDRKKQATCDGVDGTEGEVQQAIQNMAISNDNGSTATAASSNKNWNRRVSVHFDCMGCILGGDFSPQEDEDSMLTLLEDGRRVIHLGEDNKQGYTDLGVTGVKASTASVTDSNGFKQVQQELEHDLSRQHALPSPAREALLSTALLLLSKKDKMRSISSAAIFTNDEDSGHDNNNTTNDESTNQSRWMLILSHRSLLKLLLRTAPYLDEHKSSTPPMNSNSRTSIVLKRTVQMIRSCRIFFDQGIRPNTYRGNYTVPLDDTAITLWNNLKSDLLYKTHSNSCFRALIMLYLFHPSKCSSQFYQQVMPQWLESWRNIDRCPEWDFLWIVLFCRARKYVAKTSSSCSSNTNTSSTFDWNEFRKYLLTMSGYWLQLPMWGMSQDKTFPRVGRANKRSFPRSLKSFVGMESSYDEGIDFVGKLTKLLMYCSGPSINHLQDASTGGGVEDMECENNTDSGVTEISESTRDILRFFSYIKPYFNPSNVGSWTFPIGAFLHYMSYELCHRVGIMAAIKTLKEQHPNTTKQLFADEPYLATINLPAYEIVAYLDLLLPLCQQALYSKNSTVSHAGETALLYLIQVDPGNVTPPMIDFSLRALDISSVNLSHQAPAALSALSRLLQPALRYQPSIVLSRLPQMLQLSLAGIDSNDQNKTTRTLIFYRNLLMWIPCGGTIDMPRVNQNVVNCNGRDGTIVVGKNLMEARCSFVDSEEYQNVVKALPSSSVLNQCKGISFGEGQSMDVLMEEAMMAMNDWTLPFLDRVFELLRAAGEQEKRGKGYGAGSGHAAADVAQAKNVSRILKETLTYFFSGMDDETYKTSLRYVTNFISEETLPFAVKDASLLCQAVASTRFSKGEPVVDVSPGLDALVPILTEDLVHRSNKSAIYRLRCLAGAVRYAGRTVLNHKEAIVSAINFAISKSDDKVLLKTGAKLLRHTLASQCEEYSIAQNCHPMRVNDSSINITLGASAQLSGDRILWHSPSGEQIDFCVELLNKVALSPLRDLGKASTYNLQQWRKSLRLLRYSLRGCIGLLLDEEPDAILSQEGDICPREKATAMLIKSASVENRNILNCLRQKLCLILMDMQSLIVTDTMDDQSQHNGTSNGGEKKNNSSQLSRDPKICSEVCECADLLLTRRGAHHRSGNGLSIWKGQREILSDFVLSSESDYIIAIRSRSNDEVFRCADEFYYDGEDGGDTVSRALLVTGTDLQLHSLTSAASSQIPRRLRKQRGPPVAEAPVHLFSLGMANEKLLVSLACDAQMDTSKFKGPLEAYEGLIDGLCAMACHPNINVRGDAIGIVEYAFTRYGWVIKPRIPRLISAFSLRDDDENGKFGILSCAQLVDQVNSQGKRTRLAEAVKGVIKLLGSPKVISGLLSTEENRLKIAQRLCTSQRLQSLLPHEELAKFIHYVTTIFLSIRNRFYLLPRATGTDQAYHETLLNFLLDSLDSSENNDDAVIDVANGETDTSDSHWKNRLILAWMLINSIDEVDLMVDDRIIMSKIWRTCLKLISNEAGQPIQRVSVGLLGRLVSLALVDISQNNDDASECDVPDVSILRDSFLDEAFCRHFAFALAYDHKEDSSVGGGHSAQWSSGVEEILRDATSNLAPKTLYPFQRISQTSATFKIQHSQLVEGILLAIGHSSARASATYLLACGKELVSAPPNEDQRNQLVTSAEIFGGVCRALLKYNRELEQNSIWDELLLPFLDDAIQKMPTAFVSSFFDAVRFGIHHFPPRLFHSLLKWCVAKVQDTLWQHENGKGDVEDSGKLADRFALQSKHLLLLQAVLIELDSEDDTGAACLDPWYTTILLPYGRDVTCVKESFDRKLAEAELGQSWKVVSENLIPYFLNSIGHPYEKCRDHIASCLFRMCYCHKKFLNKSRSQGAESEPLDPRVEILKKFSGIRSSDEYQFKEKMRALGTSRKFIACCIHWGDAKHEFSKYVIPLLPLAFSSLEPIEGEVSPENRGLEAELVKGYRYNVADIGVNCVVTYGATEDMTRVLTTLNALAEHDWWQIRQATAHVLRCLQGNHKFVLTDEQEEICMSTATVLLADDRREVSSAAMSILTGIVSILPEATLHDLVRTYIDIANKSLKKKRRKTDESEVATSKEKERATRQQKSVFFLCAVVMGRPYDVPSYVPEALAALSKHSFEQRASLGIREVVKLCCSEFKRTHTDNWEAHRQQFTQAQLEALEDVVSTPHYYA